MSLMPTMAISGRLRFGGFKAASVASVSSLDIAGAVPRAGEPGSRNSQVPPITASNATQPTLNARMRHIMMMSSLLYARRKLTADNDIRNDADPAKTVIRAR